MHVTLDKYHNVGERRSLSEDLEINHFFRRLKNGNSSMRHGREAKIGLAIILS